MLQKVFVIHTKDVHVLKQRHFDACDIGTMRAFFIFTSFYKYVYNVCLGDTDIDNNWLFPQANL